jgi:sirohydrochlorin ferrochelatase
MAVEARAHGLVGADELECDETSDAWHTFTDLMRDVSDCAAEVGERPREAGHVLDGAIADLQTSGARMLAGAQAGSCM